MFIVSPYKPIDMFKRGYLLHIVMIIALYCLGCSKDQTDKNNIPTNAEDPVLADILQLGYKRADIAEEKDRYIVQGDIIFYKKGSSSPGKVHTEQARSPYLVAPAYRNIKVYLDEAAFSSIHPETVVESAMGSYNDLHTEINFSRVYNAADADIQILNSPLGICGQAGLPFSNGRPFDRIYISEYALNYYGFTSELQVLTLLIHELGHCIGLRHTDWQSQGEAPAIPIPHVQGEDLTSIMVAGICGSTSNSFSPGDAWAVMSMYKTYPYAPDTLRPGQQLLRDEFIRSLNGRFIAGIYQWMFMVRDANDPLWMAPTYLNLSPDRCVFLADGNLVLYLRNQYGYDQLIWSSGTAGHPDARLVIQHDGNLVIYDHGTPLWSSGTGGY
jgi:Dual-action HEIGH metallo-peptidase